MTKNELLQRIASMKETAKDKTAGESLQEISKIYEDWQNRKAKLKKFVVLWSEATSEFDNKECNTWKAANGLLMNIGRKAERRAGHGYDKTKIFIEWENGHTITDRLDFSGNDGDFNPFNISVQDYLRPQKGTMYGSTLNVGDRDTLISWEDEETTPQPQESAQITEPIQTATAPNIDEIPAVMRQLLGITETIEESKDTTETAILKASEQVERCKAYVLYLQSIQPILEAKANALIEKSKATPKISLN